MLFTEFLVVSGLALVAQGTTFTVDCTNAAGACDNDCFGIFSASLPSDLTWDMPDSDTSNGRRTASGCTQSNGQSACGANGVSPFNENGDSCDEYPYASTEEGGTGSVLRCISQSENSSEGAQLNNFFNMATDDGGCGSTAPCDFTVAFDSSTLSDSPFCANKGGSNDGQEFELIGGDYEEAKKRRDLGVSLSSNYTAHGPDPALYFPMASRREFVLSDGKRVLLLTRNLTRQFDGELVATNDGPATVVRELFGNEKSAPFRPSASKREFVA